MSDELPALTVAEGAAWRAWLEEHHGEGCGVWLTLAKKGAVEPTILTYDQALEEAIAERLILHSSPPRICHPLRSPRGVKRWR